MDHKNIFPEDDANPFAGLPDFVREEIECRIQTKKGEHLILDYMGTFRKALFTLMDRLINDLLDPQPNDKDGAATKFLDGLMFMGLALACLPLDTHDMRSAKLTLFKYMIDPPEDMDPEDIKAADLSAERQLRQLQDTILTALNDAAADNEQAPEDNGQ